MSSEYRHRFFSTTEESIRKGIFQFILYGNNISEDFFFNLGARVRNATDSLIFNLVKREHAKTVLLFNRQGLSICKLGNNSVEYEFLSNAEKRKEWLFDEVDDNPFPMGNEDTYLEEYRCSETELLIILRDITKYLKKSKEPIGVVVDSIEWIAELYQSRNHKIEFLEEMEKWKTISTSGVAADVAHKTFILLKSIEEIKKYYFIDENSSGVQFIGAPSANEIYETYKRVIPESGYRVDVDTLKKISSLVKNNGYLLKNAIHLWREIRDTLQSDSSSQDIYEVFKSKLDAPVDEEVKWEDVILNKDIKDEILDKFETFLENKGEVKKGSKGFLFHGVPGTGKTIIAKALANFGGFYFMAPTLSDIKGEYVGHSGKNLQRLFQSARENSPTLIFLDELDSLFPMRGSSNQDSFQADITNQFLAEVDGVNSGKQDIFIIGATNRIDIIDGAVTSRLKALEIPLPNAENRRKIFEIHLKELDEELSEELYDRLVDRTKHLSGRDIKTISYDIVEGSSPSLSSRVDESLNKFRTQQANELKSDFFNISLYSAEKKPLFEDIISYEKEKNQLNEMIQTIINSQNFDRFPKLKNFNGILMYGPPGNGKSIFAEAVANEFKLDLVKVIGSSLATSMQDGAIKIFDEIVRNTIKLSSMHPIVLFFDEFDAIANSRMDPKLRGALLDSIIRIRKHGKIIIMAATNKFHDLDEASTRAGRFDKHIEFSNPKTEEDIALFLSYFTSETYFDNSNLDLQLLAQMILEQEPNGVGISKIEKLCDDAKRKIINRDPESDLFVLSMDDFGYEG